MSTFKPYRMSGRCRSGHDNTGAVYHAVEIRNGWDRALCGATPGDRGNGWAEYPGDAVTCPRCLKKLGQ